MAYVGSEAFRLENVDRAYEQQQVRPAFDVIEGGGADARVRRGISEGFLFRVVITLVAVSAFVLAGVARVSLTTLTVSELSENGTLESQIAEFESTNSDMRIECSILSSSSRINKIASQNYGMVLATEHEILAFSTDLAAGEEVTEVTGEMTSAAGGEAFLSSDPSFDGGEAAELGASA